LQRIAIIGAGPIGLEAALYGATLGYDVQVYEKGRVGDHLRRWGHVSFFSPFSSNHSVLGLRSLDTGEAYEAPKGDAMLTGEEHRQRYLCALATLPRLQGRIHEGTEVVAAGRHHILKTEHIGSTKRLSFPFRLLLRSDDGHERIASSDYLLDCSGVYSCPNWAGQGGIPAPGERDLRASGMLVHQIPDPMGSDRRLYARKHTLLLGSGSSAATTALALTRLASEEKGTTVTWVIREGTNPFEPIENDPLPARHALYASARRLIEERHEALTYLPAGQIEAFARTRNGRVVASVDLQAGLHRVEVDRVVAHVGYQPDNSIYAELQVHECYASRGPMKLAAALLKSGAASGDCLAQKSQGAESLRNPEPGFFILGAKSYGKNSQFLIRLGLDQVRDTFQLITGNPELDLYS
jgi:thioredoxin reductase